MNRLTNPAHGGIRSMRLPLSNQAEIYQRLAKYEDTRLEPEQVKDMAEALKAAREALDEIVNPIQHMHETAEKEGTRLDGGIVIILSENASYLKSIAKKAIDKIAEVGE
jgi:hypothetical protein